MGLRTRFTNQIGSWLNGLLPNSPWTIEAAWQMRVGTVYKAIKGRRFDLVEPLLRTAEHDLFKIDPTPSGRVSKMNQLGDLFQELAGSNRDAERLYRQALSLSTDQLPAGDPGHALSLNNLGIFLLQQRKYDEAVPLLESLLPLVEERFGQNHVEVASCLENLAAVYRQTDQAQLASELRTRAVSIRRQASRSKSPQAL
jgi:tetratricopeptide (TPR) repeat protein